jgi:hypothetical protein
LQVFSLKTHALLPADASFRPESHAAFRLLLEQGFVDAIADWPKQGS